MIGLMDITTSTLSRDLGLEVSEILVVIAKHSVLGSQDSEIRDMLGASQEDYAELTQSEDYRRVRMYIAGRHAEISANQATGWDQIEAQAIQNLAARMPFEKDSEFLLKVAAVANRAVRRANQKQTGILDPSTQANKTVITLTHRLVQKINRSGTGEVEEVKQLSVIDGMANPSFDEVNQLLTVQTQPVLNQTQEMQTAGRDPTVDELLNSMR